MAELVLTIDERREVPSSSISSARATTLVPFPANSTATTVTTTTTSHFHSYSYSLRFGPTVRRPFQPCNLGFDFTIIYVSIFLPSGMTKQAKREGGLASLSAWLRAACRSVLSIGLYCPMVRVPSLPYRSLSILSHKEIFLDPFNVVPLKSFSSSNPRNLIGISAYFSVSSLASSILHGGSVRLDRFRPSRGRTDGRGQRRRHRKYDAMRGRRRRGGL